MSEVISFPAKERLIFTCGVCGCSTFYLYDDHKIECAGCGGTDDAGEWVSQVSEAKRSPEKDNAGCINIVGIGDVHVAKRRVLRQINEGAGNLALFAGWFSDGGMKAWADIETAEQRDWVVRQLRALADSYLAKPLDGSDAGR